MEAEKAALSLKIYEDDLNESKTDIDEDLLPYLSPLHYKFLARKVQHKLVRPICSKEPNKVYT